jgi:hypothetical protein
MSKVPSFGLVLEMLNRSPCGSGIGSEKHSSGGEPDLQLQYRNHQLSHDIFQPNVEERMEE